MQQLKVGQKAPDITLQTINGRSVQLSQYWKSGRFTLLIFLRHLA